MGIIMIAIGVTIALSGVFKFMEDDVHWRQVVIKIGIGILAILAGVVLR